MKVFKKVISEFELNASSPASHPVLPLLCDDSQILFFFFSLEGQDTQGLEDKSSKTFGELIIYIPAQ